MNKDQATAYMTAKADQLGQAVAAGDPDAASRILDQIHDDGHPAAAAILDQALADTSLGAQLAE